MGFYRNFERALGMVPAEAELIALSDQDDRWYPDKLSSLRAALGGSRLAYSDARLVDREGRTACARPSGSAGATTTPTWPPW